MAEGDITWEQMWAEEEQRRCASAEAARQPRPPMPEQPTLAPEPYFGEQSPHYPEPQPYFEFSPDTADAASDPGLAPALRVTLPAAQSKPKWQEPDEDERVEGLDEIDWQAPPASASPSVEGPTPVQRGQEWGKTWADGIHKRQQRHAR